VSPRKAMQISVKPTAVKPTAVKPTPTSRRPQPVPAEQRIGVVSISRYSATRAWCYAAHWRCDPHPRAHHRF
jgi:hypothetical protein